MHQCWKDGICGHCIFIFYLFFLVECVKVNPRWVISYSGVGDDDDDNDDDDDENQEIGLVES